MLTACFAFSFAPVQAQTITVNNASCPGATVTFGAGNISINTSNCSLVVPAPAINSSTPPAGNTGVAYSHTFTASNSPTSWAMTGSVPGLTLSNSGVLGGTPTTAGAFSLSITATNSGGTSAALAVTVSITAPSGPPIITNTAPSTATVGFAYSHQYSATGAVPITYTATGLPPGLNISSSGLISGTPTSAGPFAATITATNGVPTDAVQNITITVATPVAPLIAALSIPLTGTAGNTYPSQTFTLTAGTAPITWSITGGTLPTGLTLNPSTGVLGGVPTVSGSFTFAVQAANGTLPNAVTAPFTVVIAPAPPNGAILSLEGTPIPNPSKEPGKSGANHTGLNGAGVLLNAWAVDPVRCNNPVAPSSVPPTTPAISRAWHHNIDFDPYSAGFSNDFFDMAPNEALSYRFTPTQTGLGTITLTETTWGPLPANFITLSTKPCDFDYTKLANGAVRDFCYKSATRENSIYFQVTAGPAANITYCKLTPGTEYYFNVRWQDGRIPASNTGPATDSCANNGQPRCAGLIQIGR
ncbi:MAG: putative Ig domain-containing protein [Betaproteobacteria bacterium]